MRTNFIILLAAVCLLFSCTTENVPVVSTEITEREQTGDTGTNSQIYEITMNSDNADYHGTWSMYLKYKDGYYMDESCTRKIRFGVQEIVCPEREGYTFLGYNTRVDGSGQMMIDSDGVLSSSLTATAFTADTTLYAQWKQNDSTDPIDQPAENQTIDGVTLSGDGKTLISYRKSESVTEYTIPDGVETINSQAFAFTRGLKNITLPASMKNCNYDAFYRCEDLENVYFQGTAEQWCQIDFEQNGNPLVYGHNLYINNELVTELVLPDTITEIKECAFNGCESLQKITLPNTITKIGGGAFSDCTNLTEINLPDGITYIGWYCFNNCSSLAGELTLPSNLEIIEHNTFAGCRSLTSIVIPDSVTEIHDEAFMECSGLKNLVIPESVVLIMPELMRGCTGLESITIPYVGSMPDVTDDFFGNLFGPFYYADCYQAYSNRARSGHCYLPLSLSSVTILGGTIGMYGFENCSNITEVTLGDNVVLVHSFAFNGCDKISKTHCSSIENWCRIKFLASQNPLLQGDLYVNGEVVRSLTLPDNMTIINDGAFAGYHISGDLIIPDSVTYIGYSAFENSEISGTLHLPANLTYIGDWAFAGNREMTGNLDLPPNLAYLGECAFYNCSAMTGVNVVIPDGVTELVGLPPNMTNVTFGKNIKKINAYWDCIRIDYTGTIADWCEISITTEVYNYNGWFNPFNNENGDGIYINNEIVKDLVIPEGVTEIKDYAFECWKIESISIPNTVTSIGEKAFISCTELKSLTIPSSVGSIGDRAFSECCSLIDLVIEDGGHPSMGEACFEYCVNLKNLTFGASLTHWRYVFGWNELPHGHAYIENIYYTGTLEQWCQIEFYDEKYHSKHGMYDKCRFGEFYTNLYIGGELLTDLVIPDSISEIKDYAFFGINSIKHLTIPESVKSIGLSAFALSSITDLTVSAGEKIELGEDAFYGCCELINVNIGRDLTCIKTGTFYYCINMTTFVLANDLSTDDDSEDLFTGCDKLECVYTPQVFMYLNASYSGPYTIPNGITKIAGNAFGGCSELTSIDIPNSVTSIGNESFYYCSGLTSITIPDSVTSIGEMAFVYCSSLTSITIPDSVMDIGDKSSPDYTLTDEFSGCDNLTAVYNSHTFFYLNRSYSGAYTIPNGIKNIRRNAFRACSELTNIEIPNSVRSIEPTAFFGCSGLTSVTIPSSVTSIEPWAFDQCSSLTSVTIPSSVTSIGDTAFSGCISLRRVDYIGTIEQWCERDWDYLFYNYNLYIDGNLVTDLVIPNTITNIDDHAFYGCLSLASVTIPSGVTSIGNNAFSECIGLTGNLTIPNTVTSIGDNAFRGCSGLTGSLTIPNTVTWIGKCAFSGCSGLTSVTIPKSVPGIGLNAFSECNGLTSVSIEIDATVHWSDWYASEAFADCENLESVTVKIFDNSEWGMITDLGTMLSGCHNVKTITLYGRIRQLIPWADATSLTAVYVQEEDYDWIRENWSDFYDIITVMSE